MSTHKHIDLICVAVLVITLLITILFINGRSFGLETVLDGDADSGSGSAYFTQNDRNGGWDTVRATRITLSGDRASVSGGGAYIYNGNVVIAQAGRYAVSGTLDDGSIIVSAGSGDKIWLMLDGADISCSDDACLRVEQADKVFLTLGDGTENSMTSGAAYSEEAVADNTGGVIFSRDDLTVNGSGSLSIRGEYRHGIDVNDELVITGGTITVDVPQDGIHVNDGLRIEEAAITIRAGDEGLKLQGPDALLYIASGSLDIDSSGAAVKSEADLRIEGGSITIRSDSDGLHSGGSIAVEDGILSIRSGDDGIHADDSVSIAGGSVSIRECYEGIEAMTIGISGGEIEIYPSDDGLNANGGSFGFGPGMFMQRTVNSDAEQDSESWIHISGGSITVVNATARDADGLDSNGDIVISGGVIRVSLTSSGSNNAIDYGSESGGSCVITGGELVACGSSAMAEGFSDSSTQCAALYNLGYTADGGTSVSVRDASGSEILKYTVPCAFTSVSLSSPEMKLGETYTVVIGEKEAEFTLDAVNTTVGTSGGMGGMGGRGQMHQRGDDSGEGGWQPGGGQPGDMGDMPTPPAFDGDMPSPSDMPNAPGMRPGFNGAPPDDSAMPQNMSGWGLRGDVQDTGQDTADGAAELALEEQLPAGPQPVSKDTWTMVGACMAVLILGILIAIKYRQS